MTRTLSSAVLSALFLSALPTLSALSLTRVFSPQVTASILDQPRDGLVDAFETAFPGLLREQNTRESRAIQEFDLTSLQPTDVVSATYDVTVNVNNAFNNGLRTFDFLIYVGNGTADLTDFEEPGFVFGNGSYSPPSQSSFTVSLDVTSLLKSALLSGSGWIGIRCDPTSNPNFPNILSSQATLTIDVGVEEFGVGLPGAFGVPRVTGDPLPALNQPAGFLFTNNPPNAPLTWVLGVNELPAPISLTSIGFAAPATLYLDPLVLGSTATDAQGEASVILRTVPNRPSLLGAPLILQSLVLDTTITASIPYAVSRGTRIFIR